MFAFIVNVLVYIVAAFAVLGCTAVLMAMVPYFTRSRVSAQGISAVPVFLAHWVEVYTSLLKFRRWQYMHHDPNDNEISKPLRFLCAAYTLCSLLSPMSHEVVDIFDLNRTRTQTWLVNAYAWHFKIPRWLGGRLFLGYVRWKMKRAVMAAHRQGVKILGLGALTKHHKLTDDGMWYVNELGDDRPRLTHGDTLTAVAVYHLVIKLLEQMKMKTVFLTGATSKIGRALAVRLARAEVHVYLYSNGAHSLSEIEAIMQEAGSFSGFLHHATSFDSLPLTRLCVTGKELYAQDLLRHAAAGTAFVNFSVPDPFTPEMLEGLPFYHYEGGLLDYSDIRPNNLAFAMRLVAGKYTYACHAWLLAAAMRNIVEDELGQVDVDQMDVYWKVATEVGFKLPELTSFHNPVTLPFQEGDTPRHSTPPPATRRRRRTEELSQAA